MGLGGVATAALPSVVRLQMVFSDRLGGVLLNAKKIGNYCGFNAGSLVGNKDSQENRPEIGDYVAFGPGAKAFGKITIGDNVFVASNAVVVKDIPSNVIVGGLPAKIIKEKQNGKTK